MVLATFFYHSYFSSYRKHYHQYSKTRQLSGFPPVFVAESNRFLLVAGPFLLILVSELYKHLYRESNIGQVFGVLALFL
jgi:hypothetical protein